MKVAREMKIQRILPRERPIIPGWLTIKWKTWTLSFVHAACAFAWALCAIICVNARDAVLVLGEVIRKLHRWLGYWPNRWCLARVVEATTQHRVKTRFSNNRLDCEVKTGLCDVFHAAADIQYIINYGYLFVYNLFCISLPCLSVVFVGLVVFHCFFVITRCLCWPASVV